MVRAYGSIASRQQGADRLAFSEDDFRRILAQAIDPNYTGVRPSTIRLGSDIVLSRPISLNPAQYNITIDGGRRFGIRESRGFVGSGLFNLAAGQTADLDFVGVIFHVPTVSNLFFCDAASTANDISLTNCNVTGYTGSIRMFSAAIVAFDINIHLDDAAAFSIGPAGINFTGVLQASSFFEFKYFETRPIIARNNLGVGFGTTGALRSVDINGGIRLRPFSVTLSGADPAITIDDKTTYKIFFDGTESGAIQLTSSYEGHVIVLYFADASNNVTIGDVPSPAPGNAIIDVNKNHHSKHPSIHEAITFMYINGRWVELCRSENN